MGRTDFLERGTTVLVRCAWGQTREDVVWEDHGPVVMVCAKDQFERLSSGYPAPMPIGFKREDVQQLTVANTAIPA